MTPEAQTSTPQFLYWREPDYTPYRDRFPGFVQRIDPDGTYCCHLTPKELRDARRAYIARERGTSLPTAAPSDRAEPFTHYRTLHTDVIDIFRPWQYRTTQVELTYKPSPLMADDLRPDVHTQLDTDDTLYREAHRRYTSLKAKADAIKSWADNRINSLVYYRIRYREVTGIDLGDEFETKMELRAAAVRKQRDRKLEGLRKAWNDVYWQTEHVEWSDVADLIVAEDENLILRLNRDQAEVRYGHRDPSDFDVLRRWLVTDAIRDAVAEEPTIAARTQLQNELLLADRRSRVTQLAKRYAAGSGLGADHRDYGRVVTRWTRRNGRLAPKHTISVTELAWRKTQAATDELAGLNKTLAALRYRVVKQTERRNKRQAA